MIAFTAVCARCRLQQRGCCRAAQAACCIECDRAGPGPRSGLVAGGVVRVGRAFAARLLPRLAPRGPRAHCESAAAGRQGRRLELHPDGNSLDMMQGLIYPKQRH